MLEGPDAVRNAPHPELLPRLAVWVVFEAVMESVGPLFAIMLRRGRFELDREALAIVVKDHIDILESLLAKGMPMERSYDALMIAVQLPDTSVAELLLKSGATVSEPFYKSGIGAGHGVTGRARRSPCKDEMIALLRSHGCDEP
jgi:hypothetical protein